jgi:HEAT repeat protein
MEIELGVERRRKEHREAMRVHRRYGARAADLIRHLGGRKVERAYQRLGQMGKLVLPELVAALADDAVSETARLRVAALLSDIDDVRARQALWGFFDANCENPQVASQVAALLAWQGDKRVLPYLRRETGGAWDDERVALFTVFALEAIGEPEDVDVLLEIHRRHAHDDAMRYVTAQAILLILEESDQETFDRALAEMHHLRLWKEIEFLLKAKLVSRPAT